MSQFEVFPHDGSFIIVAHHTGKDAGQATPVVTASWRRGHGEPGMMACASAYEAARRFPTEAAARDHLDNRAL